MHETIVYHAVCRHLTESGTRVHSPIYCNPQCALRFAPMMIVWSKTLYCLRVKSVLLHALLQKLHSNHQVDSVERTLLGLQAHFCVP